MSLLSPNGFSPRIWGAGLWRAIHLMALNYPLEPEPAAQEAYFGFFRSLCFVLPCGKCRKEFCKLVQPKGKYELRPGMFVQKQGQAPGTARCNLFLWTVALHTAVAKRLKATEFDQVTPRMWLEHYSGMRS